MKSCLNCFNCKTYQKSIKCSKGLWDGWEYKDKGKTPLFERIKNYLHPQHKDRYKIALMVEKAQDCKEYDK